MFLTVYLGEKFDEAAKKKLISRQLLKAVIEKVAYGKEQNEKDIRIEMIISKKHSSYGKKDRSR